MQLTGSQYIGSSTSLKGDHFFQAINPVTGEDLPGQYADATSEEIDAAVALAEAAFSAYGKSNNIARAEFLEAIADEIMALGDDLIARAMEETALPEGRLVGERGRTVGQLRLFAKVVREGSWVDARIDPALPDREPLPRSDIRQMLQPLGPVAVFGASNFPLAFSVAGGDTASALASGCTVVIKGHPAHPGTSELVFRAILAAGIKTGMPDGVASLIHGAGHAPGMHLVQHSLIQAVGFTGSFKGGKALFDLANNRPFPIPVFAEMGSTNPVFILPGALEERGSKIAEGLAASVTLGVGQFCTNPGMVLMEKNMAASFKATLADKIKVNPGGTMLTKGIRQAYEGGIRRLSETTEVALLSEGEADSSATGAPAKIFTTTTGKLKSNPELAEEIFGPSSILIEADEREELIESAKLLDGHLTATVHGTPSDLQEYQDLIAILERKVGRIIINGFPTGVEVCHAMVHGGPYPATTNAQSTSVGTNAIKRFARPVCYQDFPDSLLPDALKHENPLNIWRLVDGDLKKE
ncbi:MAG: aldehyde dehydrogenase (NADP(+)) [Saprospiraceae bacterium]|nr:aldehyde dehydrogenase (NADP(+)) [Saprospiraceae bacterium]